MALLVHLSFLFLLLFNLALLDEVYSFGKREAEESAYKFVEQEKPGFDLVSLCPGLLIGPPLSKVYVELSYGDYCTHELIAMRTR